MLNALGFNPGRKDGYFDAGTEDALRAFQRDAGLPETGQTDEATISELEERTRDKISDPANDRQLNQALNSLRLRTGGERADAMRAEAGADAGGDGG